MAYQAYKVCLALEPSHAEAQNNLAILELKRQRPDLARINVNAAKSTGKHLYEPFYNSGTFSKSFIQCVCVYKYTSQNK
jgi:hypothetical protein